MAKTKILIVDDEKDVCETIQDRLQSLGYDAYYVLNGPQALERVSQNPPDLILLDILMPDMDGYEVSQKLIEGEESSKIPIIMLTALHSQQNKLKALTMGIDDYVTKPFDFEELVARINIVLKRAKKTVPEKKQTLRTSLLNPEDQKRIQFLKAWVGHEKQKLQPLYNLQALNGYQYPFAANFFGVNDGSEVLQLEILAQRGCLNREFFDKILCCPFCKNYNLNIRETCPRCKSADVKIVEMIHHYRCAYMGMEEEFKDDISYVCPKCHQQLKNIGVDYDKPGQNYFCEACHSLSPEAQTSAQCRACHQLFLVENALRQIIFSYLTTPQTAEVIERGVFIKLDQNSWMDEGQEVYNLRYFRSLLTQELRQARHFKRPLALILLSVEGLKDMEEKEGEVYAARIMKKLTEVFKSILRTVDVPAQFQENSLVALLVECDKKMASNLARKIHSKIQELLPAEFDSLKSSIRVVSFEEDGKSEDALLKKLLEAKPV